MPWIQRPFLSYLHVIKRQHRALLDASFLLRQKIALLVGVSVATIIGAVYAAESFILLDGFAKVEQQATQQNVDRVIDALNNTVTSIDNTARDYATWDSTYDFMANYNIDYVESNLSEDVFNTFQLDLVALFDTSGHMVVGREIDGQRNQAIAPTIATQHYLESQFYLKRAFLGRSNISGMMMMPDGIFLFAARPVLKTDGTGLIRGMLLMGRYLDHEQIDRLSQLTNVKLSIQRLDTMPAPANPQVLKMLELPSGSQTYPIAALPQDDDTITGYTLIKDASHRPSLLLQVHLPRTIYQQGIKSLHYLGVSLLLLGSLFGVIVWHLARRLVGYVAERDRIAQALFQEKELAQTTLQSIGDGVITTDGNGLITLLNPVAETLTGWTTQAAQGLPLAQVFQVVDEDTRSPVENLVTQALHQGRKVTDFGNRNVLISRTGDECAIDASVAPICTTHGQIVGTVLVFWDVTQARQMARQLSLQASYDALTGLMNRREFECRLGQALTTTHHQNHEHTLCFLDLDRFKRVNDTCGHGAGDELLRQISTLLQSKIRRTDIVARLGGDEFAILLYQCTTEQAMPLAQVLCQSVEAFQFVWQDYVFTVGVSIGLVAVTGKSGSLNQVMRAADTACYSAKHQGRGQVYVYQVGDQDRWDQQTGTKWLLQLNQAFQDNRFCLYYQTIVPLNQPAAEGDRYEALLRLVDDQGNILTPSTFMSAAERYNVTATLDRWVIRTLLADQADRFRQAWKRSQCEEFHCLYCVNLSIASLQDEQFVDFVRQQLKHHDVPPQIICFDISEAIVSVHFSQIVQPIQALKTLNCQIAIDDFGGNLTSFTYFKQLPIDYLKIDGRLIKEMVSDPVTSSIVETIHRIGEEMGMKTIAECVESDMACIKLAAIGINYAQGYGIAEPQLLLSEQSSPQMEEISLT